MCYSNCSARRTSIRLARRAGKIAAITSAKAATTAATPSAPKRASLAASRKLTKLAGRRCYRRGVVEAPLTTLHLFGLAPASVPAAVVRMGLDRRPLARTPGLRFWKLLGTGDGRTFTLRDSDPLRWGLLAVWDHPADLAAFERRSSVAAGWGRLARERWRVDLRPLRSRGTWSRRTPFGRDTSRAEAGTCVAAITRARIRPRQSLAFWRAVPPVAAEANTAPGLRFAIGIGESPIGLQGTFSVWDSPAALVGFAYRAPAHRDAIAQTVLRGWYAEELFARFAVLQATGTIDGINPLTGGTAR